MGKPRMIILVRHAQSEGNKNRDIHQFIPDHRVKLTQHGWTQAEEAGRQLRSLLKPDDTLQFFTSPYRRTRETTEGILRTLTSDDPTPSPFPRHKITVYEEPRLREQDFGNFQPCSAEMERMWQERADYGHFFYRIPNGESAADAYDRVSGFNESLWRQFGDPDFPSVCVLVTHGMMSRVFLMKWYHWSVEYFEDLRNVNHCEFIIMKQNPANGKYILQNELRTWSDLRKRAATTGSTNGTTPTQSRMTPTSAVSTSSPTIPARRWGGCVNGCNHDKMNYPRRVMRKNTAEFLGNQPPMPPLPAAQLDGEKDDHPIASQEAEHTPTIKEPTPKPVRKSSKSASIPAPPLTPASPNDASDDASSESSEEMPASSELEAATAIPRSLHNSAPRTAAIMRHLHPRGPSESITGEGFSDDSDYFPGMHHLHHNHHHGSPGKSRMRADSKARQQSRERKAARKNTEKGWMEESGMGLGARADALGDGDELSDVPKAVSPTTLEGGENLPLLRKALKGDMIVENSEGEREADKESKALEGKKISIEDIDKMQEADRKSLSEVY
ncbi:phosphoglycerate mutase-like protein [Lentithecium fluviatile CBS 122367]|uniref:Phosphoglycerate mutase-like protein n=1 Tax=Lentithecium fluviatile CBS 122367 TaxID=1168545 RepID=A0A6G1IY18_9PLEO|nr:phosphoglycerate mutase-like protein [Lentithecium fluviatile CBS 122367]